MICNLQDESDDVDLQELFERSRHDWLGVEDIIDILNKREELVTSDEPVQFPEEGLFLFNTSTYMEDTTPWGVTKSKVLSGLPEIRCKIVQCPLVPIEEGVTSTYERRAYKCQNLYGAARLVHYRSYHLSDDAEEADTGEDTEDSENLSDDSGGDDGNEDVEVAVPVANGVC